MPAGEKNCIANVSPREQLFGCLECTYWRDILRHILDHQRGKSREKGRTEEALRGATIEAAPSSKRILLRQSLETWADEQAEVRWK